MHVLLGPLDNVPKRSCSIEWVVIPAASKEAAVREWKRRGGEDGSGWPSAADLTARGIGGVTAVTQATGQLLLLPPRALAVSRTGIAGGVVLQWCRAYVASCAPQAVKGDQHLLPVCDGVPAWRRVQLHPPVLMALFRGLVATVDAVEGLALDADDDANTEADDDASTDADGGSRQRQVLLTQRQVLLKRLRQMLPPCRALIASERLSGSRPAALPLDDHAPRACDHCAREIFNRCSLILHSRTICQFPPSRTPWPKPCPVTAMPMPMYAKWHRWRAWSSPGRLPEHHDTPRPGVCV